MVAEHARGHTVFEPRVHLVPDNGGVGHFNVLRGHVSTLGDHGISGIKVVGDFVPNHLQGLPSELGLVTLYDPASKTVMRRLAEDLYRIRPCHDSSYLVTATTGIV